METPCASRLLPPAGPQMGINFKSVSNGPGNVTNGAQHLDTLIARGNLGAERFGRTSATPAHPTAALPTSPLLAELRELSNQALAKKLLDNAESLFALAPAQLTPALIKQFTTALYADHGEHAERRAAKALLDTLNLRQPLLKSIPFNFDIPILDSDPELSKAARGYAIRMLAARTPPERIAETLKKLFAGKAPLWARLPEGARGTARPSDPATSRQSWLTEVIARYDQHAQDPAGWIAAVRARQGAAPDLSQAFPPPTYTQAQARAIRDIDIEEHIVTSPNPDQPGDEIRTYHPPARAAYRAHTFKAQERLAYGPQYDRIFGKGQDRVVIPINYLDLHAVQTVQTWLESQGYSFNNPLWQAGRAIALPNTEPDAQPGPRSRNLSIGSLLKYAPDEVKQAYTKAQQWNGKVIIASRNTHDILHAASKGPHLINCMTINPANMGMASHYLPANAKQAGTVVLYVTESSDPAVLRPLAMTLGLYGDPKTGGADSVLIPSEEGKVYGDRTMQPLLAQATQVVQYRFNPSPELGIYKSAVWSYPASRLSVAGPSRISVGAKIIDADFRGENLEGGDFEGVDASRAHFEGANLIRANFGRAELGHSHFEGANLKGANFKVAWAYRAHFEGANLEGAKFMSAWLEDSHFDGANVKGADFEGARDVSPELREQLIAGGAINVPLADLPSPSQAAPQASNATPASPPPEDSPTQSPAGGVVIRNDISLSETEKQRLLDDLGISPTGIRPDLLDDPALRRLLQDLQSTGDTAKARAALAELLKLKGYDLQPDPALAKQQHTGRPDKPNLEMPTTKFPRQTERDREPSDPLPRAAAQPGVPALTQAISILRRTDPQELPALMQRWASVPDAPMLRALLTQTGLTQVLQYGLGTKFLTALSHNGLSRYLNSYTTAQVLNKISQSQPALANAAQTLRAQVLSVLAARREALTSAPEAPTTPQRRPHSTAQQVRQSTPNFDLQAGVRRLQHAATPALRLQALKQLQTQVSSLNQTLAVARAGQLQQHQEMYKLAQVPLQQMQAWLSDPQRIEQAQFATDIAWKGLAWVLTGLAAGASGAAQLLFQPQER